MHQYNLDSLSALSAIREQKFLLISAHNRELKQLRWRRLQKTIDLMIKTTALHVHHTFSYISLTSTALLRLLICRFMEDVDIWWRIFLPIFELKNSTPGKVACIWHIEWVQIDVIKFETMQIHFLATFSLPSLSLLLNPLSPESDQHQISPCNINALLNIVVMRITDIIKQDEFAWYFIDFFPLLL